MERLDEVLTIVRKVGRGAGEILRSLQGSVGAVVDEDPVTAADIAADQYILEHLQSTFGYLTEETYKTQAPADRLSQTWVWIIDPLDGTKDFIQQTGDYAVHIALTYAGRPVLAVVVVPAVAKLYYARVGGGTFLEQDGTIARLHVSTKARPEEMDLVLSGSHRQQRLDDVVQQMSFRSQRSMGSVGCKVAAIVEQQADVYLSLSGKSAPKDWDFAAPELILTEAGGILTRFDGTPLHYNQEKVNLWGGLLASNGHYHGELCVQAEQLLNSLEQ